MHWIGTNEGSDDDSYEEDSVPNSSNQVVVIPECQSVDAPALSKKKVALHVVDGSGMFALRSVSEAHLASPIVTDMRR